MSYSKTDFGGSVSFNMCIDSHNHYYIQDTWLFHYPTELSCAGPS